MRKFISFMFIGLVAGATTFLASCEDDEEPAAPVLELSESNVTASPGEEISIDIQGSTEGGFESLVVKKFWDGNEQSVLQTYNELPTDPFVYTVTDEDADHIVNLNFALTDSKGRTVEREVIITVELTPLQILLKYNWALSEEIRKKTNQNDITDAYTDDVYRFNADGTYNKSIGAKQDAFGDSWYNYCYYDLNEETMRLLMSRTGAFGEEVTDTLDITVLDETKLYADVTYYGLDQFDETYDPVEEYEKRFVAVAKTNSFDPYKPGDTDDSTGPANMCADVVFEND